MENEQKRERLRSTPLPGVDDPEGERVPPGLPFVVDAHVHVFPENLFASIRRWFDRFGWPIRYRLNPGEVLEFLLSRRVGHVVALQYAHRPGIARGLNDFMAQLCRERPKITGVAAVFPGEPGAREILQEAFATGLKGVKLHLHVQCLDILSPAMEEIYKVCETLRQPLVVHAGRGPYGPGYACDPYVLCGAAKMEQVLRDHPGLKVCVPHLGMDEYGEYLRMTERYNNLWLDTTMALAEYLPDPGPPALRAFRPDRVLYGSDFPNIPYAWDRELKRIDALGLPQDFLAGLLGGNAREFFAISDDNLCL